MKRERKIISIGKIPRSNFFYRGITQIITGDKTACEPGIEYYITLIDLLART